MSASASSGKSANAVGRNASLSSQPSSFDLLERAVTDARVHGTAVCCRGCKPFAERRPQPNVGGLLTSAGGRPATVVRDHVLLAPMQEPGVLPFGMLLPSTARTR
jgi:hypothetical protein